MLITNIMHLDTASFTTANCDNNTKVLRIIETGSTQSIFMTTEQMQNLALALMIEIQKDEAEGMKDA